MDLLKVLLFVYTAILLVNAGLSAFFSYSYKDKLHRLALYLWLGSFVNFFLQGLFQSGNLSIILSFGTYFICSMILCQILATAHGFSLPTKNYLSVLAGGLAGACVANLFGLNFTLTALPVAIGVSYPMFRTSLHTIFNGEFRRSNITKLYCALLFLNAVHFMDFPFLRGNPDSAVLGFSLALVFLIIFSILLPSFIFKKVADDYSARLETEVKIRTDKLISANHELDRINSELEALTDENKSLLNIVCHDLGDPLQIITLCMAVLTNSKESKPQENSEIAKTYEKIDRACEDASDILSQVRKLQAIRVGKVRMNLSQINPDKIIEGLLPLFEDRLKSKQLTLNYFNKLAPNVCILAEPTTLKNQVFNNLVSNAIKFSHPKSEINITAESSGEFVHLQVADSGTGMSQEAVENMFNPGLSTTKKGTQGEDGTGFGLPIVKSCLDKYGARIEVESRPQQDFAENHGTVFHIYFKKAG